MSDLSALEKKLECKFKNIALLQQALVHRSYLNEHKSFPLDHNERLEFLGDAVLELVVTEHLFRAYPNPEGELTNWCASLVISKMLAEIATSLKIEKYLHLSRGETQDQNPKGRNYILANALEAIIGAVYMDKGIKAAKKFITDQVLA